MPFAARKHEDDKTWRLCLRMGDTILRAVFADGAYGIGPFPSQAKTKACAEQLNTRWKEIASAAKKGEITDELSGWMLAQIQDHDGLGPFKKNGA